MESYRQHGTELKSPYRPMQITLNAGNVRDAIVGKHYDRVGRLRCTFDEKPPTERMFSKNTRTLFSAHSIFLYVA